MAQDIVQSLFGLTPFQTQQAQTQDLGTAADAYARQTPFQQATGQMYRAGGMLAGPAMEAMGFVNPAVEQAKAREQALTNIDLSNSDAILRTAMRTQDPRLKVQLTMMAQQRKVQEQELSLKRAQELAQLHKANAEASPFAKIDPSKYTQESVKAYMQSKNPADLVAIEKTQFESMSNEEKLVRASLLAKGLKEGTPEWNAAAAPMFAKLMDKKTHFSINTGVAGGEAPTPDEVDFYAQMAMSGDQSWRVGLGRSKDGVALIRAVDRRMPELAKEVGMSPDDVVANKQEVVTRQKVLKDFSTGTQGQLVNSFNTAIDHLDTLKELGNALNNGNLQLANKIKNTAAAWTGDADITNLDTAKQIVGAEVIKSIVARGGGQAEREEAANRISRISSPAQLAGYIDTTQKLMAGQLKSLEQQYSTGTKRKDFKEKLLPRAKNVLESLSGSASSGTMASQIPTSAPTAVRKYDLVTGTIR